MTLTRFRPRQIYAAGAERERPALPRGDDPPKPPRAACGGKTEAAISDGTSSACGTLDFACTPCR